MESELREALEKHLFNYKWGDPDGGGSKIFPAYDIRCADFHHNDFTLRASNLKEAILMIDRGNFAISLTAMNELRMFIATGCPPDFPFSTRGLVKADQRGGTGGEDDSTTFHRVTPWKVVFDHENKTMMWDLFKKALSSSKAKVRDGVNKEIPSCGSLSTGSIDFASPKQHLLKDPLKGRMKERDRIRKATKDSRVYLLGNPHWRRKLEEGNPKEHDDSGVETESSREVSPTPKKVIRHWQFSYSQCSIFVYIGQQPFTYYLLAPINFVILTQPELNSRQLDEYTGATNKHIH